MKTAEMLLDELKSQNIDSLEHQILSNIVALSRRLKSDAEYVLADFMKLLSEERYVRMQFVSFNKFLILILGFVCLYAKRVKMFALSMAPQWHI